MLEREREKLRQQQALVEVSTLLAHEIRNPLGSLELFAGLLAESDLSAETKGWVEHVQAGLRTMAATVNNVLHLHDAPLTVTGGKSWRIAAVGARFSAPGCAAGANPT